MPTRLLAFSGLLLGLLAVTPGPAAALSCVAPPPDVAEVTITGEVPDEGWYGEAEVPVVIGRVVEGTKGQPEAAGDRLALVEVIGGLRLDAVPAEIEIIADDLIGWGHPVFAVDEHLFLRVDEWNVTEGDLAGGIADGPCSWNDRYTPDEIESLLALADEYDVPVVLPAQPPTSVPPTSVPPTSVPPTTTTTVPADEPVDDAEPIAISETDPDDEEGGASAAVVVGAVAGVVLLAYGAFVVSSRR